tara:strand:- start:439 stop:1956 length:1518 start_codon:yes stop_codon:yes gene_type:complete
MAGRPKRARVEPPIVVDNKHWFKNRDMDSYLCAIDPPVDKRRNDPGDGRGPLPLGWRKEATATGAPQFCYGESWVQVADPRAWTLPKVGAVTPVFEAIARAGNLPRGETRELRRVVAHKDRLGGAASVDAMDVAARAVGIKPELERIRNLTTLDDMIKGIKPQRGAIDHTIRDSHAYVQSVRNAWKPRPNPLLLWPADLEDPITKILLTEPCLPSQGLLEYIFRKYNTSEDAKKSPSVAEALADKVMATAMRWPVEKGDRDLIGKLYGIGLQSNEMVEDVMNLLASTSKKVPRTMMQEICNAALRCSHDGMTAQKYSSHLEEDNLASNVVNDVIIVNCFEALISALNANDEKVDIEVSDDCHFQVWNRDPTAVFSTVDIALRFFDPAHGDDADVLPPFQIIARRQTGLGWPPVILRQLEEYMKMVGNEDINVEIVDTEAVLTLRYKHDDTVPPPQSFYERALQMAIIALGAIAPPEAPETTHDDVLIYSLRTPLPEVATIAFCDA